MNLSCFIIGSARFDRGYARFDGSMAKMRRKKIQELKKFEPWAINVSINYKLIINRNIYGPWLKFLKLLDFFASHFCHRTVKSGITTVKSRTTNDKTRQIHFFI